MSELVLRAKLMGLPQAQQNRVDEIRRAFVLAGEKYSLERAWPYLEMPERQFQAAMKSMAKQNGDPNPIQIGKRMAAAEATQRGGVRSTEPIGVVTFSKARGDATLPPSVLRFAAPTSLAPKEADGRRKFSGVAYSGDMIRNHWHWGDVLFDIASTRAKPRVPALLEHLSSQIVGSGSLTFGTDMRIEGLMSSVSPHAKFVGDQADEGFPWQMSVFIEPGTIEKVAAGKQFAMNGRQFVGPATIFRDSEIREVSFCATGADSKTHASVHGAS